MEAKRIRLLCTVAGFVFGLSLMGATPLAAQGNCQAVDDAMNKVFTTPTHIYTAMSPVPKDGSKPRPEDTSHSETIYVGGSAYAKVAGKWTRSEWTQQQVMKQEEENRRKSKYSCRYLRDESVNGETAAVYSTHSERTDVGPVKSDGQVWISKSRGLPLREEVDIESGGVSSKNHLSVRHEYANVQPPQL
jgi:hypothetical protein